MEYPKFYVHAKLGLYYRALIDEKHMLSVCSSPAFPEISAAELGVNTLKLESWQEITAEEFSKALNGTAEILAIKIEELSELAVNVTVNAKQGLSTEPETKPDDAQTASDSPVN